MVLKEMDSKIGKIDELNRLLELPISDTQKKHIKDELSMLKAGKQGEQDSAYFIDFKYRHSENWVVIHDLRLEHLGHVAQFDHILINRLFDFYILETKNFFNGVKISRTGEFMKKGWKGYEGIESPIEQNKRHIELLEKVIKAKNIIPHTVLGVNRTPVFKSRVLISPKSIIERPRVSEFNSDIVMKADAFVSSIEKDFNDKSLLSSLTNMAYPKTIIEVGRQLIKLHKPVKIDYAVKFGINKEMLNPPVAETSKPLTEKPIICQQCGDTLTPKEIDYCNTNSRYKGKFLCYDCQHSS